MNKKTISFMDRGATLMALIGIGFIFLSVWSEGYNIIRSMITGILFYAWAWGVWQKVEEEKKK